MGGDFVMREIMPWVLLWLTTLLAIFSFVGLFAIFIEIWKDRRK